MEEVYVAVFRKTEPSEERRIGIFSREGFDESKQNIEQQGYEALRVFHANDGNYDEVGRFCILFRNGTIDLDTLDSRVKEILGEDSVE